MILSFNIKLGPSGSGENRGRQSPRDLANVNEWKIMFDPYIVNTVLFYINKGLKQQHAYIHVFNRNQSNVMVIS